jgi:DNA-binding PadR family transcriptional regulator
MLEWICDDGEFLWKGSFTMKEQTTYPITYAVLAFLERWGPSSGYDLKRGFDHALIPFFGAVYSQIYHELRRLHELGWVEMEVEADSSRPARKRYTITQAGREALRDWQTQPLEKPQLRDELFLRTLFGQVAPPGALAARFREAIAYHEQQLAHAQAEVQRHRDALMQTPETGAERLAHEQYLALVVLFEQRFEETYLNWLQETLAFLEKREQPSSDAEKA